MSCIDLDNEWNCLVEPTTGEVIHGQFCPLWYPRFSKDYVCPFIALEAADPRWYPKIPKEPVRVPGVKRPLPDGALSAWEFTLTSPVDDVNVLREGLAKVVKSAMFEVVDWEACLELTESGLPHIHAVVYSKRKYCDGSKIKKLYPHRYEFKRVKDLDKYLIYMYKKDGDESMINYCAAKGVPQFWKCQA